MCPLSRCFIPSAKMVVRIAIENNTQRTVLGVSTFFATLATVSVGLRFWARKVKENPVKADDWCILVALVSLLISRDIMILSSY